MCSHATHNTTIRQLLRNAFSVEPPLLWLINFEAERSWALANSVRLPNVRRKTDTNIVHSLEEIALFSTCQSDVLIRREPSCRAFLNYVSDLGFSLPTIISLTDHRGGLRPELGVSEALLKNPACLNEVRNLRGTRQLAFLPYAMTSNEAEVAAKINSALLWPTPLVCQKVNSKAYSRAICEELGLAMIPGDICKCVADVRAASTKLFEKTAEHIVIKDSYGVSGIGLLKISTAEKLQAVLDLLTRKERAGMLVDFVVEKWVDRLIDVNYQVCISPSGEVQLVSIKESIVVNGVHVGHRSTQHLTDAENIIFAQAAQSIGKRLYQDGFHGIVGIDAILDAGRQLFPLLEINARFNMSTFELALDDHLESNVSTDRRTEFLYCSFQLKSPLLFDQLVETLGSDLYKRGSTSGIGLTCFATANCNIGALQVDPVPGRLYYFVVAESANRLVTLKTRMKDTIRALTSER